GGYFAAVARAERAAAPTFGTTLSPWEEVAEFYGFWLGWSSHAPYPQAERHGVAAVAAAPNRQVRRLMEAEDEKLQRQARKAFSLRVRRVAQEANQHDPRVLRRRQEREREERERERERELARADREAEDEAQGDARAARLGAARAADEARWAAAGKRRAAGEDGGEHW
ncbi:unnamed protein product, partial [Prorocentrum cordatum]